MSEQLGREWKISAAQTCKLDALRATLNTALRPDLCLRRPPAGALGARGLFVTKLRRRLEDSTVGPTFCSLLHKEKTTKEAE